MTSFPELFAALAFPFDAAEIKQFDVKGRTMRYVNAWTVMNRLDEVLGPENWWATFATRESSVECTLTVRLPDGSTLTKINAGGYAGMDDDGDDDMSGYSSSLKRAAASLGVARSLYGSRGPRFGDAPPAAEPARALPAPQPAANGHAPAGLPSQARPAPSDGGNFGGNGAGNGHAANGDGGHRNREPRTGRALFAWCKDREQEHGVGLIKYMGSWAKLQEFPGKMVDFDVQQVALAYAEAARKLDAVMASAAG